VSFVLYSLAPSSMYYNVTHVKSCLTQILSTFSISTRPSPFSSPVWILNICTYIYIYIYTPRRNVKLLRRGDACADACRNHEWSIDRQERYYLFLNNRFSTRFTKICLSEYTCKHSILVEGAGIRFIVYPFEIHSIDPEWMNDYTKQTIYLQSSVLAVDHRSGAIDIRRWSFWVLACRTFRWNNERQDMARRTLIVTYTWLRCSTKTKLRNATSSKNNTACFGNICGNVDVFTFYIDLIIYEISKNWNMETSRFIVLRFDITINLRF